jgi:hypothetical protein
MNEEDKKDAILIMHLAMDIEKNKGVQLIDKDFDNLASVLEDSKNKRKFEGNQSETPERNIQNLKPDGEIKLQNNKLVQQSCPENIIDSFLQCFAPKPSSRNEGQSEEQPQPSSVIENIGNDLNRVIKKTQDETSALGKDMLKLFMIDQFFKTNKDSQNR